MASVGAIGVQIPANQALSGVIDLGANDAVAIEMPEAFNGTTITFQGKANYSESSAPGAEDWDDVYDSAGTELTLTVAGNRIVGLKADAAATLSAIRFIRLRAGTAASPVNQNPTREFRILTKGK